jgi:hypothetical protein
VAVIKVKGLGKHPKVGGTVIGTFSGLTIYGNVKKAKTSKGHDRLWIQIRQDDPKEWRLSTSLSYRRSLDVQFEKDLAGIGEEDDEAI